MLERRRALAKPMPACFATLLRPGTGALRRSGENCRCQNHFGMGDAGSVAFEMKKYTEINLFNSSQLNHKTICQLRRSGAS
jgi:hypothetical protein